MDENRGDAGSWDVVFQSAARKACEERALVVQTIGIAAFVAAGSGDGWSLFVPRAMVDPARTEIEQYEQDRTVHDSSGAPRAASANPHGIAATLSFAIALAVVFQIQSYDYYGLDWTRIGHLRGGARLFSHGWSVITSIFLHADFEHLISNLFFGGLLAFFLGREVGAGCALLFAILCAMVAGTMDALLHGNQFRALGASMAVFAMVGMLGGLAMRRQPRAGLRRYSPLVAALMLLGLYGTSENSDVVGHSLGWSAGAFAGAWWGRRPSLRLGPAHQWLCAGAAFVLSVSAWAIALARL